MAVVGPLGPDETYVVTGFVGGAQVRLPLGPGPSASFAHVFRLEQVQAGTSPSPAGTRTSSAVSDWRALAAWAGAQVGLPPALLLAVIHVESGGRPDARSAAGALGLMQLEPAVAAAYGAQDPLDPAQNVLAGARYLRDLLTEFHGNLALALAAYNEGPARVRAGVRDTAYVQAVLEKMHQVEV